MNHGVSTELDPFLWAAITFLLWGCWLGECHSRGSFELKLGHPPVCLQDLVLVAVLAAATLVSADTRALVATGEDLGARLQA